MALRRARTWVLLVPLVVALGIALATLIRMENLGPGPGLAAPVVGQRIDPSFAGLLDTTGRASEERSFAGHLRLVSFGFTSCPDVCPTTLAAIHAALERLGTRAAQLRVVFVTVDPARDDGARLATYLRAFDARILGLRGSEQATAAVARRYGVRYAKRVIDPASAAYVVDHTAQLYLLDPAGRILAIIPAAQGARALASAIVAAVAPPGTSS